MRAMGPAWLARRAGYAFQLRSGWTQRRLPATTWATQPLENFLVDRTLASAEAYREYRRSRAPRFFFRPDDREAYQSHFARWDGEQSPLEEAGQVAEGQFKYFDRTMACIGFPPAWHRNPFTGEQVPMDRHWSRIGDFGQGDIKIIWEPNRFGFAYALVRAYWRTSDEQYAELFWQLIEDWQLRNPPQQGVNWKCGQEASLRVMAWCFGLYGFMNSPATTAQRVSTLAQMVALSGQRIEANLGYALSQHNNHGISEGVGLWTIGALFPELCPAEKWRETGRRVLENEGRALIYEDGSFSQHSVVYHRLMLHDYLWALRLGDVLGQPFSSALKQRIGQAGAFLYQLQDEVTGGVPYYGQTDGALILPLNNCGYRDFRPVVQATHYLASGERCHEPGAWDEDLLWLYGPEALASPLRAPARHDLQAEDGGYYTLRSDNGFAFTRCVSSFRHRPGQADMLHVDLWWRGHNVACDAGTYSYNAPDPWDNALAGTAYHNTVTVDGKDQIERAGKFLWLPWLHGKVRFSARAENGCLAYWEGEHDGYKRLKPAVRHRRAVLRLGDEHWLIVDAVESAGTHDYRLHWLLADWPHRWEADAGRLALTTPAGAYFVQAATLAGDPAYSLVRANTDTPRGWRAPYYGYREAALSFAVTLRATSAHFWTLLGPRPCEVVSGPALQEIRAESWQATIRYGTDPGAALMASIQVQGTVEGELRPGR
jgi:asparagine synthase (glutamine-hydrolysing)